MFVLVRVATESDLASIVGLDSECFPSERFDVEPTPVSDLVAGLGSGLLLCAVDETRGAEIVGFSLIAFAGESVFEVVSLGVSAGYRGAGVGRELLSAAMGEVVRLGGSRVRCLTAPSNVVMRGLLLSFGFVFVGLVENYYGSGKDRDLFEWFF